MTSKVDLSKEIEKLRAFAERLGLPFLQHLLAIDLPPLKWSPLKYGLTMEELIDGKEEAYS